MSDPGRLLYVTIASLAVDDDQLREFSTLFAYSGFNPEMVHAHMAKIKAEKSIGDDAFNSDLMAIITLGALKGNVTTTNLNKMSDDGIAKAKALYSKYGMKMGSLGNDRRAITLPRVLSAFPELTTKVVIRLPSRYFGPKSSGFSAAIKNPVFASLVPSGLNLKVQTHLLEIHTIYAAEQTMVISNIKDFKEAFDKQMPYTLIAHRSSVPQEAMRIDLLTKLEKNLASDIVAASGFDMENPKCTVAELTAALKALKGKSTDL